MNGLDLQSSWLDLGDNDDPAICRTFANLSITVRGSCVTSVIDKRARTTLSHVVVPLYPIAEWCAANWWSLHEGCHTPSRGVELDLAAHSMRMAGDGYSLPDFSVMPEGDHIRLRWNRRRQLKHHTVEFLSDGEAFVSKGEFSEELRNFIDLVIARLEDCNITDTWLQREWRTIQEASKEEEDFCRSAARLGLDPYDVSEETARALIDASEKIPDDIREDFFLAANAQCFAESVQWVLCGLKVVGNCPDSRGGPWQELKVRVSSALAPPSLIPWVEGQRVASALRVESGLGEKVPVQFEDIIDSGFPTKTASDPPLQSFVGLLGRDPEGEPCFYTAKSWAAERFARARGLGEFLCQDAKRSALISKAPTWQQQRSRAFAAEFLAPASLIEREIGPDSSIVDDEQIEDIARKFWVSSYVIRHQVENNNLADICRSGVPQDDTTLKDA